MTELGAPCLVEEEEKEKEVVDTKIRDFL